MMMDILAALNIFKRTAERESFAVAARDLGMSQATVTRTIQSLERYYGVELLRRSTRKMTLTEAGRLLLDESGTLLEAANTLKMRIAGSDGLPLAGQLRITAPSGFGTLVLAPLIARFSTEHPDVRVSLLCTDRYLDLVEENIDFAFRVGLLDDSGLLQRAVARLPEALVAAPAYLASHPPLRTPADLSNHRFIGLSILRGPAQNLSLVSASREQVSVFPDIRITFDTPLAVRECLLRGGGIGRIHEYLIAADLQAGRLVRLLSDWHCPMWDMSLVKTARTSTSSAKAFLAYCNDAFPTIPGIEAAR